jgi:hypothetical protein
VSLWEHVQLQALNAAGSHSEAVISRFETGHVKAGDHNATKAGVALTQLHLTCIKRLHQCWTSHIAGGAFNSVHYKDGLQSQRYESP